MVRSRRTGRRSFCYSGAFFQSERKPGVPRIAVFNLDDSSCQPLREAIAEEGARNNGAGVTSYIYSVSDPNADVYARQIEYLPEATRLSWSGRAAACRWRRG